MTKIETRPHVPEPLKRRVLVEAGHRCAIPTCRLPVTDVAHIIPYHIVKKHEYDNLIALCPTCHRRADEGEIDRESLRMYKRILQRLTDRYERFELLVLNELREGKPVTIAGNMILLIKNLLDDKLVGMKGIPYQGFEISNLPTHLDIKLTPEGKKFIDEWIEANKSLTY